MKDLAPYNEINSSMIEFFTDAFGNEGWLHIFNTRWLRREQENEQFEKEYVPPVNSIRKLEVNPYTMKIEKQIVDIEKTPVKLNNELKQDEN